MRFQKRIKIFPGVRLNLSKGGISTTVGIPGAGLTLGKRGVYANVGIPGSGIPHVAGEQRALRFFVRYTYDCCVAIGIAGPVHGLGV